jgi:hypothetical protein
VNQPAEEDREDEKHHDGLEENPCDAEGGLFVTNLQVSPDEEPQEFAVGPDLSCSKGGEPAPRLDSDHAGASLITHALSPTSVISGLRSWWFRAVMVVGLQGDYRPDGLSFHGRMVAIFVPREWTL